MPSKRFFYIQRFLPEVQSHLAQNLRVVTTRRKSIADTLYNHIKFAKNFDLNLPPLCVCDNTNHPILLPQNFIGSFQAFCHKTRKIFRAPPRLTLRVNCALLLIRYLETSPKCCVSQKAMSSFSQSSAPTTHKAAVCPRGFLVGTKISL
jgi:hypothetical protein